MIIWKNGVQLLKPTQFLFLASPHLKINSTGSYLPSLCQSPAATPPAHLLLQMLSPRPGPMGSPCVDKAWGPPSPAAPHPTICLPPGQTDILSDASDPDHADCAPPRLGLFAPGSPAISRDGTPTGKDRGVALEIRINTQLTPRSRNCKLA